VDFCGSLWISVDLCGFLWISVDFCGSLWISVDLGPAYDGTWASMWTEAVKRIKLGLGQLMNGFLTFSLCDYLLVGFCRFGVGGVDLEPLLVDLCGVGLESILVDDLPIRCEPLAMCFKPG
jgi:hypothetical protein